MHKPAPVAAIAETIRVCRPWAPPAETLVPYIERIDRARWYSNFGPLSLEFEARLAARFKTPTHVLTAANGTLALTLALKTRAPNAGYCLVPGWTFVATAHAAIMANHTPLLCDVDETSGALTPEIARDALRSAPGKVVAIVPVLPYGAPLDLNAWAALEAETGVPVIIDAAAAFDVIDDAPVPVVVSLHATKALGVGEGAFLATRNQELATALRALSTFGFFGTRESRMPALNAKLSEYGAAIGLAAMDHWPQTRARLVRAAGLLRAGFVGAPEFQFQPGWGSAWISTTCVVRHGECDRIERRLAATDIETRRWWGRGLHREPAFRDVPRLGDLASVNRLAATSIGLPFALDLSVDDIDAIARSAIAAVRGAGKTA